MIYDFRVCIQEVWSGNAFIAILLAPLFVIILDCWASGVQTLGTAVANLGYDQVCLGKTMIE